MSARRCDGDVPLDRQRACPPARAACECGDLGYLYDLALLREMVDRLKSTDRYRRRDHDLLEVAVGITIRKGRGEDPSVIWDRVDH